MRAFFALFPIAGFLNGCASQPVVGVPPVRYEQSVQVALYDTSVRQPSTRLEVFNNYEQLGGRKYHVIARVSRNANPADEGLILNALAAKARRIGAHGLVILPPLVYGDTGSINPQVGGVGNNNSPKKDEPVFRADALIFDAPPPTQ